MPVRKIIPVEQTQIPTQSPAVAVGSFYAELSKRVIGQPDAIRAIREAYDMQYAGLNDKSRPICNMLFLGPTGTGKTRTVEATAEALTGNSSNIIKIDCAEFQHSHEIARLLGPPPGYVGHQTQPLITTVRLRQLQTCDCDINFVLLDEIEKASDALWNLLLAVMDKGILTLGDNTEVSFHRCMLFMTSNIGAREMEEVLDKRMGYAGPNVLFDASRVGDTALAAARRKFSPEFINRLDAIIAFKPLGPDDLEEILALELGKLQDRITGSRRPFLLRLTSDARHIVLEAGNNPKYGARHLKRAIERLVTLPLSRMIAEDKINLGDTVLCSSSEGKLRFCLTG
jgi:ATP-dependent Clp protease ATP-binding subunit ClpB